MPKVMRKRGKELTKRAKLNNKIKKFKSLNQKYNLYKPMSFDLSDYGINDVPVLGDRLAKKRANSFNYRQRMKLLEKALDERIYAMEHMDIGMNGEIYLAEFEPILSFTEEDEEEINLLDLQPYFDTLPEIIEL